MDDPQTPARPFSYSGSELDALAEATNYYSWIIRRFQPYLGRNVVEVGAGIGTFSEYILRAPGVEQLVAIEPAENTFPLLESRFAANPRVRTLKGYLSGHRASLESSALVAVNVLEHVEEDAAFLKDALRAVIPGGSLLLFVPALPAIYGSLDRAFEHHRRYTRSTMRHVLEKTGWDPVAISYMNLPGIAAWFIAGRILRKTSIAAGQARTYDRLIVPWVSRLESLIELPIGANLLVVARRP